MVRLLAGAAFALVLAACTSAVTTGAPTPTPQSSGDSPAATLRVQLDLLVGEHVFAVAKLAVAAAAGRSDEYAAYATMLAQDGADLTAALRSAAGQTTGTQVGDAWTELNNLLVQYLVAAVTHDQAAASAAAGKLTSAISDMSVVMLSDIALPADLGAHLATAHVTALRAVIDAAATASANLFHAIASAGSAAAAFADSLAQHIAQQFPDRFPGDAGSPGADARTRMNLAAQRESYLLTMASSAAISGATDQATGAGGAIATNAPLLPPPADEWTQETALVVAYAKSGDAAVRGNILNRAAAPLDLTAAATALVQVVDDQRAKAYARLPADELAAATAFEAVADRASLAGS